MKGLAGARVIIIDDERDEALPILKELSKRGVPASYFDSQEDSLPKKDQRLPGVRLAIVDIDLVGGGISDKSKISTLLAYMCRIFVPDNGPYGILAWTKHGDLQQMFEEALFKETLLPKPAFVVGLSKDSCKRDNGSFDLNIIAAKIDAALGSFSPLLTLQTWEEKCFWAATQVTNQLASLAVQQATELGEWQMKLKDKFLQLLHAMAKAEAEQQLDADSCFAALYSSMNPLLADRMESNMADLRKSLSVYSGEIMASTTAVDALARARLNTMLHLSIDSANAFYAGNIYLQSTLCARVPSATKLLRDLADGKNPENQASIRAMASYVKPFMVEINATCDHAQNNIRIGRFLAGLIVPESDKKKIKKAEYIYQLGPVFLDSRMTPAGVYYLYFSARHLLTTDLKCAQGMHVFARLRAEAFADLQAWFAHRASRPGMLMLRD